MFTAAFTAVLAFAVCRRLGFWRSVLVPALFVGNLAVIWVLRHWFDDYPSGHVGRVACAATMACVLANARWRPIAFLGALAAVVLITLQRIASDSHTGTDCLGAALLGCGFATLIFDEQLVPRQLRR